ncbi:MAG: hypothetical protein MJZ53_05705 [Paludibacteraceae bacterium]|nr:hypothetical protein [Paludibacteraceae bacterium]
MKKNLLFVAVSSLMNLNVYSAPAVNPLSVELPAGNTIINGQRVIPEPPEYNSEPWLCDSITYFKARELRRLKRAVTKEDSTLLALLGVTQKVGTVTTVDSLIAKKREPYISWLKTYGADPAINLPLHDKTIFPKLVALDELCEKMKEYGTDKTRYRVRQRPYYYFHDYYSGGQLKENTATDSYPSGHGYFCGLFDLAMAYVDPENIEVIKRNSDTFGYQRLILGAHWETDVWAGRQLGAVTFDIARTDTEFQSALDAAKEELATYRAEHAVVVNPQPSQIQDDTLPGQAYHIVRNDVSNAIAVLKKTCEFDEDLRLDIQINRTFYCDGYFNSLCLPFSIAETEWSSANNPLSAGLLKRFVNAEIVDDVLEVNLEDAASIEAGQPYLIRFATGADIVNPIFKQVRVTTTRFDSIRHASMSCNGLFAPYMLPDKGKDSPYLLLGPQDQLYWPEEDDTYIKGFRAYFETTTSSSAPIRHGMKAIFTDAHKTPTKVNTIVWKENGQVVKTIENGHLVIISDGKKFNARGNSIR